MPLARAKKLWPLLSSGDVSLDQTYADGGSAMDRVESLIDTPEESVDASLRLRGVRAVLKDALVTLGERERRIIEARTMSDEPMTLEALGREMGVSKERVRQLEERARARLRVALADFEPMAA